jgi:16S rRNA (guanine527-N7)-methyltransferase
MSTFEKALRRELAGIVELTPGQFEALQRHFGLLRRWNSVMNLTAIRDPEEAVTRHYCESVFVGTELRKLSSGAGTVADIGSGAGFPGFPVAVVNPEWHVTLIESHQRKAVFLREAARFVENVTVLADRFQAVSGIFDFVTVRAVAPHEILDHALTVSLHIALLVGRDQADEVKRDVRFNWHRATAVPWGTRRVLLVGDVPRET